MKVLYLSITSEIGGADLALLRSIEELDKDEFQPIVGLPGEGPLVEPVRAAGAETVFFPMQRLRRTLNPVWYLKYLRSYGSTCCRIAEYARDHDVDLIHTNSLPNIYGARAARLAGRPHLWEVRELDLRPRLVRAALTRMALRSSDRVVAMSGTIADGLFGGASEQVRIIYGAVDLESFCPDPGAAARLHERFGFGAGFRTAGIWCRFDEWKGLPVAIRAAGLLAKDMPRFRLLVAGGPTAGHESYAEELRRLAEREAPGAVVFTGWLAPGEIPSFVAGLDVAVHASTGPEPFGLVIAEAMAAGTPLVAPRIGSPLELVEHGVDGLLYEAGNPAALAIAIKRFLDEPETSAACTAAGRAKAERLFNVKTNVRQLEDIYRELVPGGRQ